MAFKRKTYKGVYEDTNEHYVCDTTEDVAFLPTDSVIGSTAFVIENSTRWMINSRGEWVQILVGEEGGGGGSTSGAPLLFRMNGGVLETNDQGTWKPVPLDTQLMNG